MRLTVLCAAGAVVLGCGAPPDAGLPPEVAETLWHHRNLGKAFYENPVTQYDAVAELEAAWKILPDSACDHANYGMALLRAGQTEQGIAELESTQQQDPSLPYTWFNLGIAYKRASEYEQARHQFEGMIALVPDEPISHYNLATIYKLDKRIDDAIAHFERAAELDPNLAGPQFQLATAYRQVGRADDADQAMAKFRELKERAEGAAVPEDLEWSYWAELCSKADPETARDDSPPAELAFTPRTLAEGLDPETAGLAVIDWGGDGTSDLLAWSSRGVHVFARGEEAVVCGLEDLSGLVSLAPGDFDNDGLVDLAAVKPDGVALYRQREGRFEEVSELPNRQAALPGTKPALRKAVWLDFDHDYDLDLFVLGEASALYRNNGDAGWSDRTDAFPFVAGAAVDGARLDVVADTQGVDLAVLYADGSLVLYRDRLAGQYEPVRLEALPAGTRTIAAFELDYDGWTDLVAAGAEGAVVLANDRQGGFRREAGPGEGGPFAFADLENRGLADLVTAAGVHRNRGLGRFAEARPEPGLEGAAALAAADFDGDGRADLAAVGAEGAVVVLDNRTETANHWASVALEGVKNLKLAHGSEVEVKAGPRYQKELYDGTPLHFGLGPYAEIDTVRVTWGNGLIQNETRQPTGQALTFKEAQRLSGSCPMIFTWNGEAFEFITDVLGVAPLGASSGDGEYFPVDHDEYVRIPGEALSARGGEYEVRITEELREVSFVDEVRLIALDHPKDVEIFTNEKFKGPPFPEFRLFGVRRRIYPRTAVDQNGRDVRAAILARDQTYPDGFARDYAGVAELHHLDLDFGPAILPPGPPGGAAAPDGKAVLVLSGWVDWADGSTFLGASQGGGPGLVVPYLQVKDAAGRWRTVIDDMGIPAGKPKTIVVDLTGKFLSDSREVRIVTNLCVYWDEIFLSEETGVPEVDRHDVRVRSAELRYRGFSRVVIHPERKQPERFVYADVRPVSMWNPTKGLYTRYGDVRELLTETDDRFVVFGSGDEMRLHFGAEALPEPADGWRRDFLLLVDGWAKDGDANTAYSQTVEPLPYHGMPQYPYEAPNCYPDDEEHRLYREKYNTRPALRLIRPLSEGIAP